MTTYATICVCLDNQMRTMRTNPLKVQHNLKPIQLIEKCLDNMYVLKFMSNGRLKRLPP